MGAKIWDGMIPADLQELALEALDNCDFGRFFCYASNEYSLTLLTTVMGDAEACGKLESAFIDAFTATRTNNYHHFETIEFILEDIDLERLQEQGDKFPEQDEYRLYRGISGDQTQEIIEGYSWTSNIDLSHWFAMRYAEFGNPSIYETIVNKDAILFCTNDREEDEYVLNPHKIEARFLMEADQAIADKVESLRKRNEGY
jgi:hypothetical protein